MSYRDTGFGKEMMHETSNFILELEALKRSHADVFKQQPSLLNDLDLVILYNQVSIAKKVRDTVNDLAHISKRREIEEIESSSYDAAYERLEEAGIL